MAFKMKGSAFKLGNVATKSVLKHSGDVEQLEKPQGSKIFGHGGKKYSDEELKEHHGPVKMKSPMKDTKTTGDNGNARQADARHKKSVAHDENNQHTLPMKSPLEQEKTKFGYHDEEGKVIADATKDIVPAQQGGGSATKDRDESGSERATYQRKVGDYVRQTARHKESEKRAEKLKKKRLKGEKREAAKKSKGEKRRLQISVRGFVKPKAKGAGTKMVPSFPTVKVRKVKKGKGGIRVSKF